MMPWSSSGRKLEGTREYPDYRTFRGHTMSLSVSPQPGHAKYEMFERELRRHFETFAQGGILTIPTVCWITAGRFLAACEKPATN